MTKAMVFDCFGVLVGRGFDYTYRMAEGDPERDRDFIDETLNKANLGQISELKFHRSMAQKIGISGTAWNRVIKNAEQINLDLLAYIEELHLRYKTAILSNANRGIVEKRIGKSRIEKLFDDVIVSADVGLVKPDLQIYQLVARRLEVECSECIYVDDRPSFIEAATLCGMRGVLYDNFPSCKSNIEALLAQ